MLDRNFVQNLALKDTDIAQYLMSIYNIPVQMGAKIIVELGAGESTFALTAAANKTGGQLYSIDIGEGAVLRSSPDGLEVLKNEPRYHFIQGDTRVLGKTWDLPIDFLFHDTAHTYPVTKIELELWPKWVKRDGIIFAHDLGHEAGDGMGCRQAYNEFMESEEGKQYRIIHLMDTKILGAGVLIKL